jgi:hypothetical protein
MTIHEDFSSRTWKLSPRRVEDTQMVDLVAGRSDIPRPEIAKHTRSLIVKVDHGIVAHCQGSRHGWRQHIIQCKAEGSETNPHLLFISSPSAPPKIPTSSPQTPSSPIPMPQRRVYLQQSRAASKMVANQLCIPRSEVVRSVERLLQNTTLRVPDGSNDGMASKTSCRSQGMG